MIDEELDHFGEAKELSPEQLKGKTNWELLIEMFSDQFQELETATHDLVTRSVDTSTGDALEVFGKIVTQPKQGYSDDEYRRRIRARIAVNKSKGTWEELVNILRLIVNDTDVQIVGELQGRMTVSYRMEGALTTTTTYLSAVEFLVAAVNAGERVILESNTREFPLTFGPVALSVGTTGIGATTVTVDSTALFPDSGGAYLDDDYFSYTGKTATTLTGCSGIGSSWPAGTHVTIALDSESLGFGAGSGSGGGGNGEFSGARDA